MGGRHALAMELYDTGNVEARVLGCLIADSEQTSFKVVDGWVNAADYYMVQMYVTGLVAQTDFCEKAMNKWMPSKKEYVRASGYGIVASALRIKRDFDEDYLRGILKRIEKEIHGSPNRARYSMNNALIAIGGSVPALTDEALAAAERIGKVHVDHGETNCKTPDAAPYIKKMVKRRNR
jgi:3-methyladenine DNA glycosylase AlkD